MKGKTKNSISAIEKQELLELEPMRNKKLIKTLESGNWWFKQKKKTQYLDGAGEEAEVAEVAAGYGKETSMTLQHHEENSRRMYTVAGESIR